MAAKGKPAERPGEHGYQKPTAEEKKKWAAFQAVVKLKEVQVPFSFAAYGFVVTGIVHVEDPIEKTWVNGLFAGSVIGSFELHPGSGAIDIYDPTGQLCKVALYLGGRCLSGRFDTRDIASGGWNEGSWFSIVCW